MISLRFDGQEFYDYQNDEIITIPPVTLKLEHSLKAVVQWEAKYKRAFLNEKQGPRTIEEMVDYIRFMTINRNVDERVYSMIREPEIKFVQEYINDPQSATKVKMNRKGRASNAYITSEIIYWQMTALGIPFECEKWNLNRLITLIRVCDEKGQAPKKMSPGAVRDMYRSANKARRKPR